MTPIPGDAEIHFDGCYGLIKWLILIVMIVVDDSVCGLIAVPRHGTVPKRPSTGDIGHH